MKGNQNNPVPSIIHRRQAPKTCPCPYCGEKGHRKGMRTRIVRHLEHKRPAFWKIVYGVYQAACPCVKYFTATVEGVARRAGDTDAARQKEVDLLVRDHLSVYKVQRHLKED